MATYQKFSYSNLHNIFSHQGPYIPDMDFHNMHIEYHFSYLHPLTIIHIGLFMLFANYTQFYLYFQYK